MRLRTGPSQTSEGTGDAIVTGEVVVVKSGEVGDKKDNRRSTTKLGGERVAVERGF